MDIANDIKNIIADPNAAVTREWLDEARAKYPYFILPLVLFLERNKDIDDKEEVLSTLAISAPDRKALYDILGENSLNYASFYPKEEEPVTPDTTTALDSFLDQYSTHDEKELEILNQMIFNPTPDYSQILAAEEEKSRPSEDEQHNSASTSDQDAIINKFIAQSKDNSGRFPSQVVEQPKEETPQPADDPVEAPVETNESLFTESLAKIYIKQHKYSKALEIIKSLNLNFPEKSIYFADQIRFLQKLIITQNFKKQ